MPELTEGRIRMCAETPTIVSKEMDLFYNPLMKLNRDLTIRLLQTGTRPQRIALPLAGTGVRALRILAEVPDALILRVHVNDFNVHLKTQIEREIKRNQLTSEKLVLTRKDASACMLEERAFDYIDIDPYGSPIPFLDAAVRRIQPNGILAVTATDTAALCGTSVPACKRKYNAVPLRTAIMKEIGIRILIRRVQLFAAAYGRCFEPIVSYAHRHYLRVFLRRTKGGSQRTDALLKQHQELSWCPSCVQIKTTCPHPKITCGPCWNGRIQNESDLRAARAHCTEKEEITLLDTLIAESQFPEPGFIDIHALCKKLRRPVPKFDVLARHLQKYGFSRTVFSPTGIRTRCKEIDKVLCDL